VYQRSGGVYSIVANIKGSAGTNGTNGTNGTTAGIKITYNTATSGDPGSGKFRFNSTTLSAANSFAISETDGNSVNIASFLAALDDSDASSKAAVMFITADATKMILGFIVGTITDNGAYDSFSWQAFTTYGTPANNDVFYMSVVPSPLLGSEQIFNVATTQAINNDNSTQTPFFTGTGQHIVLQALTDYIFECQLQVGYVGTVNSNKLSLAFNGTVGGGGYMSQGVAGAVNVASSSSMLIAHCDQPTILTDLEAANTSNRRSFRISGMIRAGLSGGNADLQIKFNTAPTNSGVNLLQGTFLRVTRAPFS
jgi:hypothetical protein